MEIFEDFWHDAKEESKKNKTFTLYTHLKREHEDK